MAKRSFTLIPWTPVAVANTTNFTDGGYCALQGGSSTQMTRITDIYIGGQATASAPTPLLLAHDSTIGGTLTALTTGQTDAARHTATAPLVAPVVPFTASATKPQRSATLVKKQCAINAFGGVFDWSAGPGDEVWMLGNTASLGELSLSCYTGGTPGLVGTEIVFEPM